MNEKSDHGYRAATLQRMRPGLCLGAAPVVIDGQEAPTSICQYCHKWVGS